MKFWGECALTAAYLINRTPSKLLKGKTLYKVLFGVKPKYDHIKLFGSLCFASYRPKPKGKFAPRTRKCIFVGYPYGKKGWKLYNLETSEIFVSWDAVFYENIFSFSITSNGEQRQTDHIGRVTYKCHWFWRMMEK